MPVGASLLAMASVKAPPGYVQKGSDCLSNGAPGVSVGLTIA